MFPQDLSHLLFRKQFFFGPDRFENPEWNFFEMPSGYVLSSHPDLEVTRVEVNGYNATLLGFMLDPDRIHDSNEQILTRLCESVRGVDEWIEQTAPLSGRWIIFLAYQGSYVVFNDPAGLRTIFYHLDGIGKCWLASRSGLIAEKLGFSMSELAGQFFSSENFTKRKEGWIPGVASPFDEVKHLLPNHLLDISQHQVRRYWPTTAPKTYSLDQGVQLAGDLLKNSLRAAAQRAPLALSLSSGVDSRMLLAAGRDLVPEMYIFSLIYRHHTEQSDDIRVPAQLAGAGSFDHHIIDCRGPVSPEFTEIYNRHMNGLNYDWSGIVESRRKHIPENTLVVKGSISEIVRCRYWSVGAYPFRVTLNKVVTLMNRGDNPLVVNSLREWMQEALSTEKTGYKLLDLLSWECEVGNYLALGQLINDLAQEDFCPLNNRQLLTIMLGVNPRYRSYPDHILQRSITRRFWPEMDQFPYTPSRVKPHKTFRDSLVMNGLRWVKYELFEEKSNRLDEKIVRVSKERS